MKLNIVLIIMEIYVELDFTCFLKTICKKLVSFCYVFPPFRLCIHPHGTTPLQLDEFSLNLCRGFTAKTCRPDSFLAKIVQK